MWRQQAEQTSLTPSRRGEETSLTSGLGGGMLSSWLSGFEDIGLKDQGDRYEMIVQASNINPHDFQVDVDRNTLYVKGESAKEEGSIASGNYRRSWSRVERTVSLPEDADIDNIKARFENNKLCVKVPKARGSQVQRG